jgi:hypothetical protein
MERGGVRREKRYVLFSTHPIQEDAKRTNQYSSQSIREVDVRAVTWRVLRESRVTEQEDVGYRRGIVWFDYNKESMEVVGGAGRRAATVADLVQYTRSGRNKRLNRIRCGSRDGEMKS